jgi:methyl-accepting chemotaxis protein
MLKRRMPITAQLFLLLLVVLIANAGAYFVILQNMYYQELESQAKTVVANVEAFGAWVSRSGRVWTRAEDQDFLSKIEVQEVGQPDTVFHFYSKNPALATREFSEVVAQSQSPAKFRMTSHNVMNPNNKPDAFELRALEAIQKDNLSQYSEHGKDVYRFASPVVHVASCISCHGDPANAPQDVLDVYGSENGFGFQEGDLAGVISVTLPKRTVVQSTLAMFSFAEAAIIFISILPILWFVRRAVILPVRKITLVTESISKGKEAEIDAAQLSPESANEIDQLTLAVSRMRSSFSIAMKKMKEAREAAKNAEQYAQELEKQLPKQ